MTCAETERCHCGQPLHYHSADVRRYVEAMIAALGPTIRVTNAAGRTFVVPRHYIALHGLKERDLAALGFPEILRQEPSPHAAP